MIAAVDPLEAFAPLAAAACSDGEANESPYDFIAVWKNASNKNEKILEIPKEVILNAMYWEEG